MNDIITRNAEEFGVLVRQGGWRLGLLVARSVFKGKRTDKVNFAAAKLGKIPGSTFAEIAGTSTDRVLRYLAAWELAADAGLVPHAADLAPGQDVDTPDPEQWAEFYPPGDPNLQTRSEAARKAMEAAAEEEGTTASNVLRVAQNAKAVAAAIKADPEVARIAARALDQRDLTHRATLVPPPATRTTEFLVRIRRVQRELDELIRLSASGDILVTAEEREPVVDIIRYLRAALEAVEDGLLGDSLDVELARLLEAGQ